MGSCFAAPGEDVLDWLLDETDPAVRFYTLTELLGKAADDPEATRAKAAAMMTGLIPAILGCQEPGGYWGTPDKFYTQKYGGTVWQLLVLAELGADPADPRVKSACEFILDRSHERELGGFSMAHAVRTGGGRASEVIPCLTGNTVWSLIRLGYLHDARVQRAIEWLARYQRFDDGIPEPPAGAPWEGFEMCWGTHTCHMGAVKALKALSAVPEDLRSPEARDAIRRGVEYMLVHRIHKRSHDLSKVSKPGWLKLGFPRMYQTDVLEVLDVLTRLGCGDERMSDALGAVLKKRDQQGRWKLEDTFNDRMPVPIEQKGQPSKWITARAYAMFARHRANPAAPWS